MTFSKILTFFLFLSLLGVYTIGYADRDLWAPDEPREAELAREMWVEGTLIPHLNGQPFLEKPFLPYILVVVCYSLFQDTTPLAARLPTAFFVYLTLIFTFLWARELKGNRAGLWSVLLLGSFSTFLEAGHDVLTDPGLAFFNFFSLYFFYRAYTSATTRGKWQYWLYFLGIGLAFLCKGLIGIAFPILSAMAFFFYEKKKKEMLLFPFWSGLLLPILAVLLWTWILWKEGGWHHVHYYYYVNHVERFFNANLGHKKNFFYYFYSIFSAIGPLMLLFPLVIYKAIRSFSTLEKGESFLFLSFVTGFLFLSINSTKRTLYLLPLLPSLAILGALWMEKEFFPRLQESYKPYRIALWGHLGVAGLALCGLVGACWFYHPDQILWNSILSIGGFFLLLWTWKKRTNMEESAGLVFLLLFFCIIGAEQSFIGEWNAYKSFDPTLQKTATIVGDSPLVLYKPWELHKSLVPFHLKRTFKEIEKWEDLVKYGKEKEAFYIIMPGALYNEIPLSFRKQTEKLLDFQEGRKSLILIYCSRRFL